MTVEIYNPLQNALLLVVLIVLTVLSYYFMVYLRSKRATQFGNLSTLQRVHGFKRFNLSPIILVTKIIIIVILFLVATETIEIRQFKLITDTDFVVLIDSSSSMSQTDYNPNRLSAAKEISRQWLDILPNQTRIGFVSFAQDVNSFVPLTFDKGRVESAIFSTEIDYGQSGTSLDYSLNYAFDLFDPSSKKRSILLFTDGTDDINEETITRANALNVNVYAFGIGDKNADNLKEEVPEEFRDFYSPLEFNFTKLELLSNQTFGKAYHIRDTQSLQDSFRQVTLEDVQVKLNTTFYIVLLIALLSIFELIIYSRFGAL